MDRSSNFDDLVMGLHSIAEAINGSKRSSYKLYASGQAFKEIKKKVQSEKLGQLESSHEILSSHAIQERAKTYCEKLGFNFQRVPSQAFLATYALDTLSVDIFYKRLSKEKKVKLICLDQVTDVHNAAAIMRTAAFYGVDYIVVSVKGSFGKGPSFSRIASGAIEHVQVVKCASLPKFLANLEKRGVDCIGLSEHADSSLGEKGFKSLSEKVCLVFGAEDKGLSHAVTRVLKRKMALKPKGLIKSLNVSVATAITMEKIFG